MTSSVRAGSALGAGSSVGLSGPSWQAPAAHVGDGAALLAAVEQQGLPGVVAKRTESVYWPGTTSKDWLMYTTDLRR